MASIIKKPLVTEKNTLHAERKLYAFEVERSATKDQIKSEIEKAFRVKVSGVRTINCRSRQRRAGMRVTKVAYWKKALVQLAPGEKIALFEGA